ncbi:alkaline phosphatase family protein [Galbitalea sp. SE-J8]|uniref:alkaline phosphatase family protein n=1 Tax=Galbitalea sp. SE-J8 TaxID=3054952 RepID=UPI00259CC022|nr:nucleotide pyrophosphatase/phosphodiesterase family protein [Galbitalea sp. SE-J8]MDM4763196.1 alkaline phosphatase family protein [Galbitalea sp. SE-J8]
MLPTQDDTARRLADVLVSAAAATRGEPNRLGLRAVRRALVVLVDGLGVSVLQARAGHARTLAASLTPATIIRSGFPTTTAAALASLTTGASAGTHGLVGYTVRDPATGDLVAPLSGLAGRDLAAWQPVPTVFEAVTDAGGDAVAIGPERYRDSGFTGAVLRGARYLPARTMADRVAAAVRWAREPGTGVGYLYVPELDMAAHAHGWSSPEWTRQLETLEAALGGLAELPRDVGALLTADHGLVDIPVSGRIAWDDDPELTRDVVAVAGDPRCLHVHAAPGAAGAVLERWSAAEGGRSWVASRDEAIAAGWFGAVDERMRDRIGDVLVAARKAIAYYRRGPDGTGTMTIVGQHGSWSPEELRVPLVPFGAFAR